MTASRNFRIIAAALFLGALFGLVGVSQSMAQEPDPEKLAEGAQIYAENCAMCHGSEGQGRVGATISKDWPSIRPDLTVRTIIAQGIPGSVMPAWSQANGGPFTESQLDALVYFVLSWQTGGAPEIINLPTATAIPPITPIPEIEGDPNQGAVLFAQNCVVCHGSSGEGRIGANLGKDWAGIRPDLSIATSISNGVPGSKMPAWGADKGGPLTDTEIEDITAYIMTLPVAEVMQADNTPESFVPSWLAGWGGILILIVLLALVIGGALYYQKRFPPKE